MTTDSAGYHAALETYTGDGTQSLLVTDKLDTNTRSVFWNDNDTTKQTIHGSVLSELLTSSTSKSGTWGGHQTFSIDPETDCIGDLYLSITLNLNVPDSPLDTELNPKTLTTMLQKPSSRDAINDSSKTEPIGWQIRGIGHGDTLPKAGYIGTPNGWLHLKTDANDLGSGYMYSDTGMDGVDNYGLPIEAVSLSDNDPSSSQWGVGPDSAPRAQAWEDIEDVLKKDTDLFKVNDFNCAETYLDPSDTQEVIFQRNKDIGIGEFLIQDQGRTASDCYTLNTHIQKPVDRVRSFNITDSYYHTGMRNKFNDEFTHPERSDQNSFTASSLFNDENLAGLNVAISGAFAENLYSFREQMIGATFPDTVDIADLNSNLNSYSTELSNTMNVIASEESLGTWSGDISAAAVNIPNRGWDHILYFHKFMQQAIFHSAVYNPQGDAWTNTAAPFGDGRPQTEKNIWNPVSYLSFDTDQLNNGSIAYLLITADPYSVETGDINNPVYVNYYAYAMKLYMSQFPMSQAYKNWPGNVMHVTQAVSEEQMRGKEGVADSILEGENEPTPPPKVVDGNLIFFNSNDRWAELTENTRSLFEDAFEEKPGGDLVTASIEPVLGDKYNLVPPVPTFTRVIRIDFWKPHTVNGRKITTNEMETYITSTRSILTQIQAEVSKSVIDAVAAAYVAPAPSGDPVPPVPLPAPKKSRVFWTIKSYSGNSDAILSALMFRNRPYRQAGPGVGNFIGGGVNNDFVLSENDVLFDLAANNINTFAKALAFAQQPAWLPRRDQPLDLPVMISNPNVFTTDPSRTMMLGRIGLDIPNNIYKLGEVLSKGSSWAESFTKLMRLYSVYLGNPEYPGTITFAGANYIGSDNDNTEGALIKGGFNISLGSPVTSGTNAGDIAHLVGGLDTLTAIATELANTPPAFNTIKNKKGHDNIISPSLIPSIDHPTLNPYTYSYLPKYLTHTESEEIKKIGTEYIDLKSDGTYCLYRSTDVLASDLFVSYLSKTDIINLVNHYNNKNSTSVYPLTPSRGVPEYVGSLSGAGAGDETEISYLQKIEAVEDPPKRPDNLVFYQSDFNGYCTAISADGNTYAVSQGRMYGDDSEGESTVAGVQRYRVRRPGLVRVYKKENDIWILNRIFRAPNSKLNARPKGHVWNVSNGYTQHVDLSGNGNRIVIGDAGGDNNSFTTYDYNVITKTWATKGEVQYGAAQTIIPNVTGIRRHVDDGDLPEYYTIGSEFGSCLSLSEDGNRIALAHSTIGSTAILDARAVRSAAILAAIGADPSTPEGHALHEAVTTANFALAAAMEETPPDEHCVKIYNWDGLGWQEDSSIPDITHVINHPTFVEQELESVFGKEELPRFYHSGELGSEGMYDANNGYMINPDFKFSRGTSLKLSGDGKSYIVGNHWWDLGSPVFAVFGEIAPYSGYSVYKLNPPSASPHQWIRTINNAGDFHGYGYSVAINYDGTRYATSNIRHHTGISTVTIHEPSLVDPNNHVETGIPSKGIMEIYGEPNSFMGTSLAFDRDGTKLAIGCPYGIYEKHPIYKNRTRDRQNKKTGYGIGYKSTYGRRDVLSQPMGSLEAGDMFEGQDINTKYIKERGGSFYDTVFGAKLGWAEHGSTASLGMRSKRQRSAAGVVLLYEEINGSWERVLEMDSSSGERNKTDKKSWPGTYGKYGTYKGTADGLGISVSMDGDGNNILAGAPLMSTIGKLQEQLDWYPGGGMTAAYSIHDGDGTAKIEDGDSVSSVLMADKSLRSHTRETEEEVGRSYMFTVGKYTHNPTYPTPRKPDGARPMEFAEGYNIVNDAQVRINHDITDFINLPEIGKPIRWDKQFASVPGNAIYPPFRGDYQRPEWADSDLKSKVKFPILGVIKKVEILVDEKVWQTIEQADLLAIYSTEMSESSYNLIGSNSSGRLRSDGTRQAKNNGRWIPGKKYTLSIPIPGFTSGVESGFNNFTQQTECGFLAGLTDSSNFKVKVYYNDLENVWDINNVSAMQGYTAPIYSTPHVTNLLETGANSSSLITDGARYETIGKSSGNGLYVTNVLEPWTPGITFDIKMYGQKIILHKDELKLLKTTIGGITKKINISKNVNNSFLNVSSKKPINIDLDSVSMYASHLIINLQYTNPNDTLYLKTAQLFLNAKPFSILDGGFMRGISNRSLGLYNNEYDINYNNLDPSGGNYVFPMANKAFGGSSVQFDRFDSIRLELIFENSNDIDSAQILADNININVTVRGLSSIKYKDGISSLLN